MRRRQLSSIRVRWSPDRVPVAAHFTAARGTLAQRHKPVAHSFSCDVLPSFIRRSEKVTRTTETASVRRQPISLSGGIEESWAYYTILDSFTKPFMSRFG